MAAPENHHTVPSKTREEGELSNSEDADENPNGSMVQSTLAAGSSFVPSVKQSTQGVQGGGSNNIQMRTTIQPISQKSIKKNQLPLKSSPWTGHASDDKNLVISFSDDDSGSSDFEKGTVFRSERNVKRPNSSLEYSNKLQLPQNSRSLQKEMPKKLPSNRTFIPSTTKIPSLNSKGAGSWSLGQGSRARNFNPMNRTLASREHGRDQGAVSNDNKLQDLRHQIALRETKLKLKTAQLSKESALVLGRDQNATSLKNEKTKKNIPFSSGAAQLEPKEPDMKRMKLDTTHDTSQVVGGQQVPVVKSILPSKDSPSVNICPQERNMVDHNQKEIPSRGGESTIIKSQRQPDNHLGNPLQNMPCKAREGDVNYGCNQTGKSSSLVDPCATFNQNAIPANLPSSCAPTNLALSNAVLVNHHNGNASVSEHSSIDLQSLFGMEELIDKELEEAQEHRHNCEIEERNAHRAYLKAQRSLLEANARCNNLYHKRELYLAKLRSLILNNSSFSWSLGQHQQLDIGLDYVPKLGYQIPTSSCLRQAEYNINNPSFDSNDQGINNRQSDTSYHHTDGANLGTEHCVEPDASTSEPLPQRGNHDADGVYSPMDEFDTSDNENEEISLAEHASNHFDAGYHRKQDSKVKQMDIDTTSNANCSTDSPQDSLLLEATLRSELFARLGKRAMKSSSPSNNIQTAERGTENEVGNEKSQLHHGRVPLSNAENNDLKGIDREERSIHLDSNEIQSQQIIGGNTLNVNYCAGSGDRGDMPFQDHHSTNSVNIPPLTFRSVFSDLREMSPFTSNQLLNQNKSTPDNDGQSQNATCLSSDEAKRDNMMAVSMPVTIGNLFSEEGSYGCSPEVDPFWPLCMYELRGKCNNDECPWQHAKDYGDGNINQHQDTGFNNGADSQDRLPLHQINCNGVTKVTKYHKATILPTYLVSLDVLKADQFAYKPIAAQRIAQYWQQHFSITLATMNLLQNGSPADGPLSHGGGERIEVHGAWSKQLSIQWRNGVGNQIKQAMADSEQAVETALLILNQEINKLQGVRKALSVLSKALETNQTSVVIWIVYMLIYYGGLGQNETEDMFSCAVKLYEGSYVLWLMYINSRIKLDDRLAAYDTAFSALCQHASAVPEDRACESACILDLFLQMMDCLCMSGNVEKAIQKSCEVFSATTKSDEPDLLPLSDILNCLTISDKCVLWICCVYLVIYRKLPGAVVQKFECEKDLLDIEWPFVSLSDNEKERAVKLMETAVEYINSRAFTMDSEVDLKYAQHFALNHLRCMVALDSLECSRILFDKYIQLYPFCIELVLVSAQIQKQDFGVGNFVVFEDAISRWPKIIPGIQCIWNQYIANAIHNQRIDLAKEITVRWFHSVWQVQDLPYGTMNVTDDVNSSGLLGSGSKIVADTSISGEKQMDMTFGYLNLSVYYFFQNDKTEACIAVDKARNTVKFVGLEPYIRKYVMFLVCDASSLKEDDSTSAIKKMFEVYMDGSSQALLAPRVLTRKFLDNIKKPRLQSLIGNILKPVSFDCSPLNLILQSCFGSFLLPQTVSDPKHLVDFVEGIMEVVPYNFQLAIAVCKLLSKDGSSSDLNSTSLWFWACSTLVNAILDCIPIPPEYVWVEAAEFLKNAVGIETISQRFYKKALSVYPFSIMLWRCYYKLFLSTGDANKIVVEAKERGINIDLVTTD
ncbi:uncharacterized protein LOC131609007 isoform X3 [Vicia villosa]|uniref:uncharacterized protein LOC131609007 isoform X3 n=1 Tax=Vicia villosa TaxID=3911 RepID=UPI00273C35D6|nr:uncharacterized protein LOC131609007 isoform X3 [Vicia villosa]